ncbi:DNA repair protein RadA [Micropruina sonneratiae]|uniref:DNA repair protein RadA n=1 Tax=Micropruina sonneratiae TaxID=2986940 RepID=UPI0022264F73|nr:DNA repair protein RadA [Micropruina sp. KQZ13P-5]MCW3156627.1 DNA repair protein RadA [Micropruina sp. KQZ13P-5]
MAKTAVAHRCSECGWTSARWVGRCTQCQSWGSMAPHTPVASRPGGAREAPTHPARPIGQVPVAEAASTPTGVAELDRVLGEGLVAGAVVLLAGEPGVGKSTLLLDVAGRWASGSGRTLYVSAEESAAQVRLRAGRIGALADELYLAAETDLGAILAQIEQVEPRLLVLDSVQAVTVGGSDGVSGGVAQVREVTNALVRVAKARRLPVLLVGHVTKEGTVAGPRLLEHLVDVVLSFEGDRHSGLRLVRATKNRFGPADEVGCFEMTESGIREVVDPSRLFASARAEPVPGTALTVTLQGRRPLLSEVQALVAPSAAQVPRRVTHGLESGRVSVILAVLQRKAGVRLHNKEAYVSTVGGAKLADPAADLAVALAVASAAVERTYHRPVIALGEVGLSGELRPVAGLERRLAEARRLGFTLAIVPPGVTARPDGMKVVEVASADAAVDLLGLRPTRKKEYTGPPRLRLAGPDPAG